MAGPRFSFDRFVLDAADRRLTRDGAPVELNARYLDALALLVAEAGRLVSKDRFMAEVWRGVPVTDEALTQCIRTLRRQLGDEAARPRFIETAPKHGYRFIAPVSRVGEAEAVEARAPGAVSRALALRIGLAGAAGGAMAGVFGGTLYNVAGRSPAMGAISVLLVLVCLTMAVGVAGGAGVGFGVAAGALASGRLGPWTIAGGALGGWLAGALGKLVALDAVALLFGRSPGEITGAMEGALLGAAVGVGVWLGGRGAGPPSPLRAALAAGLASLAAGAAIPPLGGRLMAGSLDLLAQAFPDSRLRLGQMGGIFGEPDFGPTTRAVVTGLEALLFGACLAAAITWARRR
ncbi:MAG: transcriptional regulator [Caulobacteraceae bacterium]|nr:transcriptional regulator [Caulobacteraceae bacterium]